MEFDPKKSRYFKRPKMESSTILRLALINAAQFISGDRDGTRNNGVEVWYDKFVLESRRELGLEE